ncbi:hypothetical protein HBB16_21840 [Pseudonocardia sp. MCCB 268]|nr:hypothetical protein [Pseudonocardia cytotoxica]
MTGRSASTSPPRTQFPSLAKAVARVAGLGGTGLHTVPAPRYPPRWTWPRCVRRCAPTPRPVRAGAGLRDRRDHLDRGVRPGRRDRRHRRGARRLRTSTPRNGVAALCPGAPLGGRRRGRRRLFCTDARTSGCSRRSTRPCSGPRRGGPPGRAVDHTALPARRGVGVRRGSSTSDRQIPLGRRFRALKLWRCCTARACLAARAPARAHRARRGVRRPDPARRPRAGLRAGAVAGLPAGERCDAATTALLERVNADGRCRAVRYQIDGRLAVRVAFGATGTNRGAHLSSSDILTATP